MLTLRWEQNIHLLRLLGLCHAFRRGHKQRMKNGIRVSLLILNILFYISEKTQKTKGAVKKILGEDQFYKIPLYNPSASTAQLTALFPQKTSSVLWEHSKGTHGGAEMGIQSDLHPFYYP